MPPEKTIGMRRGRCLGRDRRRRGARDDHRHLTANQFGRQRWQPIISAVRPAVFDRHVLTFDIPDFVQALAECRDEIRGWIG